MSANKILIVTIYAISNLLSSCATATDFSYPQIYITPDNANEFGIEIRIFEKIDCGSNETRIVEIAYPETFDEKPFSAARLSIKQGGVTMFESKLVTEQLFKVPLSFFVNDNVNTNELPTFHGTSFCLLNAWREGTTVVITYGREESNNSTLIIKIQ